MVFVVAAVSIMLKRKQRKHTTTKLPDATEPEYATVAEAKANDDTKYKMDINSCYAMAKEKEQNNIYEEIGEGIALKAK